MTSIAKLVSVLQKDHGKAVGGFGAKLHDMERVPTGIFSLDLATGGGFPRGRITEIFGPESSGKTNQVLLAIAAHQKLWPDKICVFFDIENAFDPVWAALLGVDVDKLVVMRPDYAEQAVDMVEAFVAADDVGLIVVDSLAALITTNEAESGAEKATVGGTGLIIGKMVRKTVKRMQQAEKAGNRPTVLWVNQIRSKIGVMYGDPETTPGGNAPKFAASMRIRTYGKNIINAKVSKTMPVAKETSFILRKWKCPVTSANGLYTMVTVPHNGLSVGECDDANTVIAYMKKAGALDKIKDGWKLFDEVFALQDDIKKKLYSDKLWGLGIRKGLIEALVNAGIAGLMPEHDEDGVVA